MKYMLNGEVIQVLSTHGLTKYFNEIHIKRYNL